MNMRRQVRIGRDEAPSFSILVRSGTGIGDLSAKDAKNKGLGRLFFTV